MNVQEPIKAKLVITGMLECRDADGNLLKTIPMRSEVDFPLSETKEEHDDQRSQ